MSAINDLISQIENPELPLADLVTVAEFGEPIHPYLKPMDTVCNAPDSDLWYTLIKADNYHALQFWNISMPRKWTAFTSI